MNVYILLISLSFVFTTGGKPILNSKEMLYDKFNNVNVLKMSTSKIDNNDSITDASKILLNSINEYKNDFSNYIDITALNVKDKTEVTLPEFDINYIAPSFQEVMYKYQINLETILDSEHFLRYENFRKTNYSFDKYITLNSTKYENLNINTKYNHISTVAYIKNNYDSLKTILINAGLSIVAIEAFIGATTTLASAISTSFIPVIGGGLAIALATGALIALSVILVSNYELIKNSFDDIKNWFINQFTTFANLIRNYFNDAFSKCENSTIAGKETIDGKEIIWNTLIVKTQDDVKYLDKLKNNDNYVTLMRNVKKYYDKNDSKYYTSYWMWSGITTYKFVTDNNLYDLGISTYTFFESKAVSLLENGTVLLKNNLVNSLGKPYKLVKHNFDDDKNSQNGFNHYHVYECTNLESNTYGKVKNSKVNKTHSFFGEMHFKNNGD